MKYKIVTDEAQTQSEFLLLGGFILPDQNVDLLRTRIAQTRGQTRIYHELHGGSKINLSTLERYIQFADLFFDAKGIFPFQFKCMIIDRKKRNHRKYNGGDPEKGFFKHYFNFLLWSYGKSFSKKDDDVFEIIVDDKDSPHDFGDLTDILNNGFEKYIQKGRRPFLSTEPKNSHDEDLLQLNDILLWPLGALMNGFANKENCNQIRLMYAEYILERFGLERFDIQESQFGKRFSSWYWVPKEELEKRPRKVFRLEELPKRPRIKV